MIVSRTIGALVTSSFLHVRFSQLFDQLTQWQVYFTGIRKGVKLYNLNKRKPTLFSLSLHRLAVYLGSQKSNMQTVTCEGYQVKDGVIRSVLLLV